MRSRRLSARTGESRMAVAPLSRRVMSRYSVIMRGEALDLVVDGQVHLAAAHRFHIVGGQQFRHALDGGQRSAHFVGDQRNHVVLGLLEFVLPGDVGKRSDNAQHRAFALFVGGNRRQAQRVLQRAQVRGW